MNMSTSCRRQAECAFEILEGRRLLSASGSHIPGELLVSFEPGMSRGEIAGFYREYGFTEREALDKHTRNGERRLKLVSVPAAKTLSLIRTLERDPRVAYAEPNYLMTNVLATAATPTESLYPVQWSFNNTGQWSSTPGADVDAPEAWNVTTGSPDVLIAVIDSGVDYNHPDLAANIWTNPFEVAGDGIDNDANGYVDDVHGINAVTDSGDPMDDGQHGTLVAGVIGATPFNEGVFGVAHRVGIVSIKLITAQNTARTSDIAQAFQYVNYLKHVQGQNIVATNNSWGVTHIKNARAVQDAMAGADQPGMQPVLHLVAAHNNNDDIDQNPIFPASYALDNIVSVAATDWYDQYADFSSYGAISVDLAAPGFGNIASTSPNNRYEYTFGGTSAATPFVTGAAALVWSAFPTSPPHRSSNAS